MITICRTLRSNIVVMDTTSHSGALSGQASVSPQANPVSPQAAPHRTRADLHCHSTASQLSKLGVQRALGLPECATPPREVYELAKRRGMDFVTITDHDTIAGVLEIAEQPDVFVSEELTAWFRGEPQAVHVLCFGITPDDHDWLQAHRGDVVRCAGYLAEYEIACALAHPFYAVEAPLTPSQRRLLAQLFPVWETRNGSRARELNAPAAIYIETHGGVSVGGSDDHAGIDIGRTFTEALTATTPVEFLAELRAGRVEARGQQGSAAKWAHSALALAARALGTEGTEAPDPRAVLRMAERIMVEGDARRGGVGTGLEPEHGRGLLRAWLSSMELECDANGLLALLQDDHACHADLERRARRRHERRLARAVDETVRGLAADGAAGLGDAAGALFAACTPAIPYLPALTFLSREQSKLVARDADPVRVALVADGVGGMHGVTHTLAELRERGLPGHEVEIIGTDHNVDRRLAAVAEVDIPFYPGLKVGVPSLFAVAEALAQGRYDAIHLCSPGPAGVAAALIGRVMGVPVLGSYHTELAAYARLRASDPGIEAAVRAALAAFYGHCRVVLSPSAAADASLAELGVPAERLARWDRGVDLAHFSPALRDPDLLPGELNVLYAGRLSREKGLDLLAEAFLRAHERDPRLHLVLAGGGPEEGALRARLGDAATFLGWIEEEELARVYASADLFLFASQTDTFGQVILEAQASGLPVLAVAAGGAAELIEHGSSGWLTAADPSALAGALNELAHRQGLRARLTAGGRAAVADRGWDGSLRQLAAGYRHARGVESSDQLALAA